MLGYDLNESPFVSIVGKQPWGSVVNPLRASRIPELEQAWDHAAKYVIDIYPSLEPSLAIKRS